MILAIVFYFNEKDRKEFIENFVHNKAGGVKPDRLEDYLEDCRQVHALAQMESVERVPPEVLGQAFHSVQQKPEFRDKIIEFLSSPERKILKNGKSINVRRN